MFSISFTFNSQILSFLASAAMLTVVIAMLWAFKERILVHYF